MASRTRSFGRRQNNDSPSIIILDGTPFALSVSMSLANRGDISPRQLAKLLERATKVVSVDFLRILDVRVLPHVFTRFLT